MKTLVVFYSRTGTTKKVAQTITDILRCDIEEIFDTNNRDGALGYFLAGRDATLRRLTTFKPVQKNPAEYDLVILGTPIWAFTMSTPIRTYISENKEKFKEVAFFCTEGGSGGRSAFRDMEDLCKKKPLSLLELKTAEVIKEKYSDKVEKFIEPFMWINKKSAVNAFGG